MDSIDTKYKKVKDLIDSNESREQIKKSVIDLYNDLILVLINKKDRYYGYILMNFNLNIDFEKDIIAGVSVIDKIPFTLTINPYLLFQFTLKEIIFILCHEVEHLVLMHPIEVIKRRALNDENKMLLLNYAMDASVNESLKKDIENGNKYMKIPSSSITADTIKKIANLNTILYDESFVYYYDFIKNLKIVKHINLNLTNSKVGGEFIYEDTKYDLIGKFIKESLEGAPAKLRGNLPSYQKRNLDKLFSRSKLNWKNILKQYVGNIPNGFKRTKTKLNRRDMFRYDLSGRTVNHTLKLVIAIDTSGSMTKEQLNDILNEIYNIVKTKKYEIILIQFDAMIHSVKELKNKQNIDDYVKGGGGTKFQTVVDYVNSNRYFKDAILIWFTDGYGENNISKPNVYKNLWVILNGRLSLNNPYGRVMKLND